MCAAALWATLPAQAASRQPASRQAGPPEIGVLALPHRPGNRASAGELGSTRAAAESASELASPELLSPAAPSLVPNFYAEPSTERSSPAVAAAEGERLAPVRTLLAPPSVHSSLLDYSYTRRVVPRLVAVATRFNTDYRTRSSQTEIPLTLRGRGLGGRDLPIGREDAYRNQLPPDFMPTDLVLLPVEYCYANQPIYLRREAAESLVRMLRDAQRQGLTLRVVSGYRDISHQQRLFANHGGRRSTVARPGKSEHMLGTTVDLTSTERYLLRPAFARTPEGRWLAQHAPRYGWKLTVVSGSRVIEPWHFRYFGQAGGGSSAEASAPRSPSESTALRRTLTAPVRAAGSILERMLGR